VRFGVLGTLTVLDDDGGTVRLGGPARRRLLAGLLARVGRTVPVDTLVDDLWADAPPATAAKTLQSHVVRLRDDLGRRDGGSPLVTEPLGYRLDVPLSSVDAWCFERDLGAGRRVLAAGDAAGARPLLEQALSWWRGEAYAEFPDATFAVSERLRLAELRALGEEAATDAALALGADNELVAGLEARVRHEPYRERTWEQLVLALYRAGRQGDALAAYRRARARLVDDLGLEPSADLRALEGRVLEQDPTLLVPVASSAEVVVLPTGPAVLVGAAVPATRDVPGDGAANGSADGLPLSVVPLVVQECPYRGLAAYDEADSAVFVGRERLTAELAGRLVDNDLLVVAGPSGAGKSSVVRAGLVPSLRGGALPGSAAWRTTVTTPGSDPLQSLENLRGDLVVVDQAEELFTLAPSADRAAVGRRLAALLSAGTRVVLVLRADFYGRLAELEVFTGRIGSATVLVGPMTEDELRRVVTEPAQGAGVSVAPGLADEVVAEVRGQAGSLPLLSAALERTWRHRTGDRLTLDAYHEGGGVRGALESMAEEAYLALDDDARTAARRMLLRMTTRSGGVWVRRPVLVTEVAPPADVAAVRALDRLALARLVTVSTTTVELSHEALLGGWPRLREWLDERAMVADQLEHLATSASAWEHAGRPPDDLVRGARLQAALDWQARHPDDLSDVENGFLAASREAVGAELVTERRRRRRLTIAVVGVAIAAVVASCVGVVAVRARSEAQASALSADARRLAALSYTAPDVPTSLLLAAAGYRLQDSADTRGALQSAIQRDGGAVFRIPTEGRLLWVGAPADGSRVLTMDNSRTVLVFDPAQRSLLSSYRVPAAMVSDISPDGRLLVACGPAVGESGGDGRVSVLDATDGAVVAVLPTLGSQVENTCALFTKDGQHLVVGALLPHPDGTRPDPNGMADGIAVYATGHWAAPAVTRLGAGPVAAFGTSRDRVAVEQADGTVHVLSVPALDTVASGRLAVGRSCDDQTSYCGIALDTAGTHLALVDPARPQTPEQVPVADLSGPVQSGQGLDAVVTHLAYSPDGTRLAAAGADGSLLVLAAPDAATVVTDPGTAATQGLAWAGTGATVALYTGGLDSELTSWDLASIPRTIQLGGSLPPDDEDQMLAGTAVVGTRPGPGGTEQLFSTDVRSGRTTAVTVALPANESPQWFLANGDGSRAVLALQRDDGSPHVLVWDVASGRVLLDHAVSAPHNPAAPYTAALSDDGRQAFVVSGPHQVQVVDVASGDVLRTVTVGFLGPYANRLIPMPFGTDAAGRLVVAGYDPQPPRSPTSGPGPVPAAQQRHQQLALVDPGSGTVEAQAEIGQLSVTALAWSHDGTHLAVGTGDGSLSEFDAGTLRPVADRVRAHNGYTLAASYSPDGSALVTSGTDGTVSFWDPATLRRIGSPTALSRIGWVWAWYSSEGTVSGLMPGTLTDATPDRWFSMPGNPSAWLADACRFAGRDLTTAEWARYVGDQPYQHVCPASG
jgi:DNA-binding SARP family transcriptional activator/WD40 repeat protein